MGRLDKAIRNYEARLGRPLTGAERKHLEESHRQMEVTNMSDGRDTTTNLVRFTKKLEDDDRERQAQDRREDQKASRNRAVSNLTGMASGETINEKRNRR